MGEWMMFPTAEEVIQRRANTNRWTEGYSRNFRRRNVPKDLQVHFDSNDIANLDDVKEAGLWDCEIPLSDDGF